MTNVVSRDGYNIPKILYDGQLVATSVVIGDKEDFTRLIEQVTKSGVFIIRKSDPTQAESVFFAMVDGPTSLQGYRIYPATNGMTVVFVTISNPSSRPTEMLFTGTIKAFTAT